MAIWWEKTVEYLFVLKHFKNQACIAPLDGLQEKAGDVLLENSGRWTLIEFKRDIHSLDSEIIKFGTKEDYQYAKTKMAGKDGHHLLIYGAHELSASNMKLGAVTYFERKTVADIEKKLAKGISHKEFVLYLVDLINLKAKGKGDGGATSARVLNFDNVVAVGVSKTKIFSICLSELCKTHQSLDLALTALIKKTESIDLTTATKKKHKPTL